MTPASPFEETRRALDRLGEQRRRLRARRPVEAKAAPMPAAPALEAVA